MEIWGGRIGPPQAAHSKRAVIRKLESEGCTVVSEDYPASIELLSPDGDKFFIPKPLLDDGYTADQIGHIHDTIERIGVDILPIDDYVH